MNMKWMEMLLIGAVIFVGLKMLLKTLKVVSIITIAAVAMILFWLWQNGMLPLK
jgi:predicted tellurium resistance membrane protein TerC